MKERFTTTELIATIVIMFVIGALFAKVHTAAYIEEVEKEMQQQKQTINRKVSEMHTLCNSKVQVVCIETEMTTREMLWHLQEAINGDAIIYSHN